jgi:hypothetical protein
LLGPRPISVEGKGDRLVVRAEDALIAALKVKVERPEATITYRGPRISRLAKAIL